MDLEQFARELSSASASIATGLEVSFRVIVKEIEETAKEEIGVYQPAYGPFDAWAPLAESTKADRVRRGYSDDEPLLRSGELRESIQSEVVGLAAIVGTKSEIGLWQEVGTERIPPRPFIGPAYIRRIGPLMEASREAILNGFEICIKD
ncbi:phage virion morphogenesis protein [Pantoea agglomerans]|uniref:phage virion morphogenesis protein n=1 Tax=Enterobacter agglomerans TaxID=549 RepID=UPI003C7D5B2B